MIALFTCPLNDQQPSIMNGFGNVCVFFCQSTLMFLNQIKVSLPWIIKILNSSLNITLIQIFICHHCFSVAHYISSICVAAGFPLTFLLV